MNITNQPDGDALLHEAQRLLMDAVLPDLPSEKAYQVRMIARSMGMARRELQLGATLNHDTTEAISRFLQQAGFGDLPADEHTLARLIREHRIPDEHLNTTLPDLLRGLTQAKLSISNPRHLS